MWNGSDPYPDPVSEEAAYTLQSERAYYEWLDLKPICAECCEPIGDDELIDFSEGSLEEGCTFHKKCVEAFFDRPTGGNLCECLRSYVFDDQKIQVRNR